MIVAITGYGQASDRERSTRAGFDHHLLKPVDLTALQTILDAVTAADALHFFEHCGYSLRNG